ncbi:uncharacterized protein LOC103704384 [Phoenix dactylifera]|uniref:Uncharacterized protein LOC103704384 n=1 Tax=Phoenix dactylifera TaxID=42345 RepID=A0A8B7BUT5_PHODC|nr:uncharacterized protein LOC103704384 [Phoenix dactylifera]XP_008785868.1 uncharacterized protein LOC103704384 [Phoenix dactylifera]XP_008785869.1 uncharacterized protein LOC103704384 [Phoenix dactylifera]XP_008785870.1 uncharacterized protein LOC103704384 [Phoenix dactylifera]
MSTNTEEARKAYAEFEEKVRRTVFLDNLSHKVTPAVIKMALGQFGNVVNVEFIPNYTIPYNIPQCALVEMEDAKQANSIITEMTDFPFMMSGMPRPIRARRAKAEMFADRPAPPDRKIEVRWVDPSDPDFQVAKKLKEMVVRHKAETLALVKLQLEEEEKLAMQQAELLKSNFKKFEMIENIMQDGAASCLARHYGVKLADE